jgi:hypothetical protein
MWTKEPRGFSAWKLALKKRWWSKPHPDMAAEFPISNLGHWKFRVGYWIFKKRMSIPG